MLGDRSISIVKELTKIHETVLQTTLSEAIVIFETKEPRGEYVLVLKGRSLEEVAAENIVKWDSLTLEEHMKFYQDQGYDKKEAMKAVAKDRGISKRDIYQLLI